MPGSETAVRIAAAAMMLAFLFMMLAPQVPNGSEPGRRIRLGACAEYSIKEAAGNEADAMAIRLAPDISLESIPFIPRY